MDDNKTKLMRAVTFEQNIIKKITMKTATGSSIFILKHRSMNPRKRSSETSPRWATGTGKFTTFPLIFHEDYKAAVWIMEHSVCGGTETRTVIKNPLHQ